MTENLATLIKKRGPIRTVGVIGMGYVGIPAAALFADVPHFEHVYGFQRDSPTSGYKINMLNRGESPLKGEEPGLEELLRAGPRPRAGDGRPAAPEHPRARPDRRRDR